MALRRSKLEREAAKLAEAFARGDAELRWHDLRHTFASILVAQGEDAVYVSEQLGHADAAITFRLYAHLFDRAERRQRAAARLDASHGRLLGDTEALSRLGR
jgi:integrase